MIIRGTTIDGELKEIKPQFKIKEAVEIINGREMATLNNHTYQGGRVTFTFDDIYLDSDKVIFEMDGGSNQVSFRVDEILDNMYIDCDVIRFELKNKEKWFIVLGQIKDDSKPQEPIKPIKSMEKCMGDILKIIKEQEITIDELNEIIDNLEKVKKGNIDGKTIININKKYMTQSEHEQLFKDIVNRIKRDKKNLY